MSRATTKSLRAKGRLNILACSTPDSYIQWMGSKDIGMHTRFITVPLKEKSVLYNAPQAIGLTSEEQTQSDEMLQTLRKTKGRIDIADVEESINCWQESKKRLGLIIAPNMISQFIHRIGIMAMRGAAVTDDREQVKKLRVFPCRIHLPSRHLSMGLPLRRDNAEKRLYHDEDQRPQLSVDLQLQRCFAKRIYCIGGEEYYFWNGEEKGRCCPHRRGHQEANTTLLHTQ